MGGTGPVPKRSELRRGHGAQRNTGVTKAASARPTSYVAPNAASGWHQIAKDWFESLKESGQAKFYEPSDWATAYYVAEAMSRSLQGAGTRSENPNGMSAQMFQAVSSAMAELLTTEGARRRVRMELVREEPEEDAGVIAMERYRKELGA